MKEAAAMTTSTSCNPDPPGAWYTRYYSTIDSPHIMPE